MLYAVSDIHGEFDAYIRLLRKLALRPGDTLYVLGDVVDRGPDGIRVLQDMMGRGNVVPVLGNHEFIMACCLRFLNTEITEEALARFRPEDVQALSDWLSNGGEPTMRAFRALSPGDRREVMDYLGEFRLYEEVRAGGRDYVLVHAGIENFSPEKPLEDYSPADFLEGRDILRPYWPDKILVSGHTPTRLIPGNPAPDKIYRDGTHIHIDCGCAHGGALGALCLDTGEELYVPA